MQIQSIAAGLRDLFRATLLSELDWVRSVPDLEAMSDSDVTAAAAIVAEQLEVVWNLTSDEGFEVAEKFGFVQVFQRDQWHHAIESSLRTGDGSRCRELLTELRSRIEWIEQWYRFVGCFAA